MDGDVAPIAAICDLADKYNAHHLSRRGPRRRHVRPARRRHLGARRRRPTGSTIIEGTLGKAFGVMGGYIAADRNIVDVVRSYAPGFIFTTSLSPVLVAGALASVRHLKASTRRARGAAGSAPRTLKAIFAEAQSAGDAVDHPHRAADGRRPGQGQEDQRHPARRIRRLRAADQLSDRARAAPSGCASRPARATTRR